MRRWTSIAGGVVAAGLLLPAVGDARPKPDAAAIRDAIGTRDEPAERYVSARALTHYMRAIMARTEGDSATELAELRLAALYDAENPYAHYELAREQLRLGDPKSARAAADEALALDPNHAPTLALVGRIELQSGNAERAAATLKRAVALVPAEAEPTALLIDALLATGAPSAAATAADKLSGLVTDSSPQPVRETVAGSLGRAAASLAREGRVEQAERFYRRAAELEPNRAERQVALARFYESRDRAGDAAECYARAVDVVQERTSYVLDAARLFLRAGQPARAADYISVLANEPKGNVSLLRLGQMLEEGGAREEAIRAYQTAGLASAGWGEPLVRAGRLLEGTGRYAEAAVCYRAVSVAEEQHAEAGARAELCDLRALDPRRHDVQLITRLRALSERAPAIPEVFDLLARALVAKRERVAEAVAVARAALERWPGRAESLQTLGRVLLAQGKAEAFELLEKVAGLLPEQADAQLDLAEAALGAGHADAAQAALNRAESLLQAAPLDDLRQRAVRLAAALTKREHPARSGALRASRPR